MSEEEQLERILQQSQLDAAMEEARRDERREAAAREEEDLLARKRRGRLKPSRLNEKNVLLKRGTNSKAIINKSKND